MRLATRLAPVVLVVALTGCPGGHSNSAAAPPPTVSLETPESIVQADARSSSVQAVLASIALSTSRSTTMRYLALRKLEEVKAPDAVSVGEALASSPQNSTDASFLAVNGLATLERLKTPESAAALARARSTSTQAAAAAATLERSGH